MRSMNRLGIFLLPLDVHRRVNPFIHLVGAGADLGGVQGVRTPPWDDLRLGILQKKMWFIGVSYAIS